MNLRNRAKSLVIRTATLARLDELAFYAQAMNRSQFGLVVAMHETPAALEGNLREQLSWVSKRFTISRLEDFAALWDSPSQMEHVSRPPILFTFDDGRESNYHVGAPLVEAFGGRGVFFVVPEFSACAPDTALDYYRKRINPDSRPGDESWEDWRPMSPQQISSLAARGHAIGNHTLSHQRLVGLSPSQLQHEVGESARQIASWTGKPVDAFAWTFGWDAVDARAWDVIRRFHRFCFAPCPGVIDAKRDMPSLLWRREIEAKYPPDEYRFLYSGLADLWWGTRRRRLRKLLKSAPT